MRVDDPVEQDPHINNFYQSVSHNVNSYYLMAMQRY
jgi:hypothetical protein